MSLLLKKSLFWLPGLLATLWFGSILVFFISKNIKVDKVEKQLAIEGVYADSEKNYNQLYEQKYIRLGENLPLFYFEILPSSHCPNKRQFANGAILQSVKDAERRGFDCSQLSGIKSPVVPESLKKASFYFPVIYWYGGNNQYHHYLKSLLSGNWGTSVKDGKQVWEKIAAALNWTLAIVLLNFILAIIISLLLAIWMWRNKNKRREKAVQGILNGLFSMPGFFLATIVLIFFTGSQYGMPLFYTPLYIPDTDGSFFTKVGTFLARISPVIFCLTLQDTAYLTRLIRSKIEAVYGEQFMDALKSRGADDRTLIWQHALPNAMLPLITLVINSLPSAIAGSLIYEVVFNIPGMGRLLHDSIQAADWPVVYGITFMSVFLTVLIFTLGDLLYKWADPRIKS